MPRKKATGRAAKKVLTDQPSQQKSKNSLSRSFGRSKKPKKTTENIESTSVSEETITTAPEPAAPQLDFDTGNITTFEELQTAITAGVTTVTLGTNIIATENILINHDLTLNLNNYSIISEDLTPNARVLDVRRGEVMLNGPGKIFAMGANSVAVRAFGAISSSSPHYTSLTIGENVTLYAPDAYGVLISPNLGVAYGLTVNLVGQIIAHDGICLSNGVRGRDRYLPTINILETAQITADEGVGVALDASGYGRWKVQAAKLKGALGAILRTGVLEFSGAQIVAGYGAVFQLSDGAVEGLNVKVDGGIYIAEREDVIAGEAEIIKNFSLENCELCSNSDHITDEIADLLSIKEVSFRSDVAAVLAELATPEAPTEEEEVIVAEPVTEEPIAQVELTDEELLEKFADAPEQIMEQYAAEFEALDDDLLEDDGDISLVEAELMAMQPQKLSRKERKQSKKAPEPTIADEEMLQGMGDWIDLEEDTPAPIAEESASDTQAAVDADLEKPAEDRFAASGDDDFALAATPAAVSGPVAELELGDDATDEAEIMLELAEEVLDEMGEAEPPTTDAPELPVAEAAEKPEIPETPPAPELPLPNLAQPPAELWPVDERAVSRAALADALADIRKIQAEDYEVGFTRLEEAIAQAEEILADPQAEITEIHMAVAELLESLDGLEERTEMSLSDEELDDLFYHGAVLAEMLRPLRGLRSERMPAAPKIIPPRMVPPESGLLAADLGLAELGPEADYGMLNEALATINELKLSDYTAASQMNLLETLDHAQQVLQDEVSQSVIDELATNLIAEISKLEPVRVYHSARPQVQVTAPAPVVNQILPATMLDEMAPTTLWSQGVTMIDEQEPFVTDAEVHEKILRAMRPWVVGMAELATEPLRRAIKSLRAGVRAGVNTYRETLNATKN